LALPAGTIEKVLVYSHDLYCPKLTLEDDQTPTGDLQVKEALDTLTGSELRDWQFLFIDDVLYGILPMTLKRQPLLERRPPNATTT